LAFVPMMGAVLPVNLNAARVAERIGVALFGSLAGGRDSFVLGVHLALTISAALLLIAAATIFVGGRRDA
jgi:DHA2 family methylenomycin A resistance protein-like MFS transporter